MHNLRRCYLSTIAALALGGCMHAGEEAIEHRLIVSEDVESVLAYAERVRLLGTSTLMQEYARVRRGYSENNKPADRIRLALLLSVRQASFRDDAQARGLLLQAASDSSYNAKDYRALASLLLVGLDERRELERTLEDERRQRTELARKLQQLRTIEEEIDRRRPASTVPSP